MASAHAPPHDAPLIYDMQADDLPTFQTEGEWRSSVSPEAEGRYYVLTSHPRDCELGWPDEKHPALSIAFVQHAIHEDEDDEDEGERSFVRDVVELFTAAATILATLTLSWVLTVWSLVGWWPIEAFFAAPGLECGWEYAILLSLLVGAMPLPALYAAVHGAAAGCFSRSAKTADWLAWRVVLGACACLYMAGIGSLTWTLFSIPCEGVDAAASEAVDAARELFCLVVGMLTSAILIGYARARGGVRG